MAKCFSKVSAAWGRAMQPEHPRPPALGRLAVLIVDYALRGIRNPVPQLRSRGPSALTIPQRKRVCVCVCAHRSASARRAERGGGAHLLLAVDFVCGLLPLSERMPSVRPPRPPAGKGAAPALALPAPPLSTAVHAALTLCPPCLARRDLKLENVLLAVRQPFKCCRAAEPTVAAVAFAHTGTTAPWGLTRAVLCASGARVTGN